MERKLFTSRFNYDLQSDWQCPTCSKGLLRIKKGTFLSEDLSNSRKAQSHNEWDPSWDELTYICLLECTNEKCREIVSSSGEGFADIDVEYDEFDHPNQIWKAFFLPKYFNPHLKFFDIPKNTPSEVNQKLNESFKLFFISPDSASNHVRAAVEALLNNLKIKRFNVSKGKRYVINLHQRINLLPSKYDELKEHLIAVKWLGNAGSHTGKVLTADDVLDSYEIIEHILSEIYANKASKLKTLTKKVNKAKGPKS